MVIKDARKLPFDVKTRSPIIYMYKRQIKCSIRLHQNNYVVKNLNR